MAVTYIANANAAQSPNPAPRPGQVIELSLPVNADGSNAANWYQALKASADGVTYLQAVARFQPPVTPGTALGFSVIARTGTGTGTVTPSGVTNGGNFYVVKIVAAGAPGVATFALSLDGGATFGTTITVPASYTDASGVTLAFAGTFVAGDTYSFKQAFTPIISVLDSLGAGRFLVSHNGFDGGRILRVDESWPGNEVSATVTPTSLPHWIMTRTGTSFEYGFNAVIGANGGLLIAASLGTTSGDSLAMTRGGVLFAPGDAADATGNYGIVSEFEYEFTQTNVAASFEVQHGLVQNTFSGAGLFFQSAGAALSAVGNSGSGGPNTIATGITLVTGQIYRARIETHSASSAIGNVLGACAIFFVNGQPVAVMPAANVPTTRQMTARFQASFVAAGTAGAAVAISPLTVRMNRTRSSAL